jgi:hypothetical protein
MIYKISAVNDVGEGLVSTALSVMLGTVPATPTAPIKVTAAQTTISISWIAPDNGGTPITEYVIHINSGAAGVFVLAGTSSTATYTAIGLTTGQSYRLKAKATNAIGSSSFSPESAEIVAGVVPDQPGLPTYLTSTKTQVAF